MRLAQRALWATTFFSLHLFACSTGDSPDAGRDLGNQTSDAGTADSGFDAGEQPDAGADAGTADLGEPDLGSPDMGVDAGVVVDVRIPNLSGPVTARFDDLGVLHLSCADDADCFAAQGYFHASHRFGQMDLRRRFASGRLSEVFGIVTLDTDRASRSFIATQTGDRMQEVLWRMANNESRAMVQAYTRGVNAWIEDLRNNRNGAALTFDYAHLIDKITNWTEEDSVACILALIADLSDRSAREIELGMLLPMMPPEAGFDLYGLRSSSPATILPPPAGFTTPIVESLMNAQARLAPHHLALAEALQHTKLLAQQPSGFGSNNWVISPSMSASGNALLANDPHLGLSNPSVWYLVNIDSKTNGGQVHAGGFSFAGLPGVILGQNEDIAWGATTTNFDLSDVYIETLNAAGDAVIFNGEEVPIVDREFTFEVDGLPPQTETFRYVPHHGPIVSEDPMTGTAISVRWSGHQATTDLNVIWGLMTSTTMNEAKLAISDVTTIAQNWVVIDTAGDIGWFPYNGVPNRPWASAQLPPWLPLPGDGSAEWQGTLPLTQLPQAENPAEGYIITANNDMTGALADGDPTNDGQPVFQAFVASGYRGERILERVSAEGSHTPQTMSEIQADNHSLLGERTVPRILAAAANEGGLSADAQALIGALGNWDFTCPTGLVDSDPTGEKDQDSVAAAASIGCTAFHVLWPRLITHTFGDEIASYGLSRPANTSAMVISLTRPMDLASGQGYWDDLDTMEVETADQTIVAAIEDAGAYAVSQLGADPDDWRWGRIHTITLRADLFDAAGNPSYNNGPYANDGGLFTVDVANPRNQFGDDFSHRAGASMRLVCEAQTPVSCTIELPGGQRNFTNSPYYDNLMTEWLVNAPAPLNFTEAQVSAAAVETVMIQAP